MGTARATSAASLTRCAARAAADALMMTATWDWAGVEAALDEAQALGLNVLRTWAFAELAVGGNPSTPTLQRAPGVYDDTMFRGAAARALQRRCSAAARAPRG
jgi:hypothetical protein